MKCCVLPSYLERWRITFAWKKHAHERALNDIDDDASYFYVNYTLRSTCRQTYEAEVTSPTNDRISGARVLAIPFIFGMDPEQFRLHVYNRVANLDVN